MSRSIGFWLTSTNDVKLSFETKNYKRKYIEMDVYAYQMSQTITYTINDVEVGSYHIKCYYEFALSKNDPKLTLLFERFARYCESAAEFKEAMITGEGI